MKESKWYFVWRINLYFKKSMKECLGCGLTMRFCKISFCWECNCLHLNGFFCHMEIPLDWIEWISFGKYYQELNKEVLE